MIIDKLIDEALIEDIREGDHTSLATIPQDATGKAQLIIKQEGVLAGTIIGEKVFRKVDPDTEVEILINDGSRIKVGDIAMQVSGKSISLLTAERLALNFMQRMSGVASQTRHIADLLEGLHTKVLDTRKTTPLLRELEKYSVRMGGGLNHRFGLFDMILIKDNHIDFAGGIQQAINATHNYLKNKGLSLKIEIEVRDFEELNKVLEIGNVHRIMLDNFTPEQLKEAIKIIDGRFETEASGGITIKKIRSYAESGVDYISVGALTHQIQSLDMSLKAI